MKSNAEVLAALPRDTRLAGRTAVVTGSSSGIGEAIARVLAASGAEVVVTGRDRARAEAVAATIHDAGGTSHAVTADLGASPDAVRTFAREATAALGGRVDILVTTPASTPLLVGDEAAFVHGALLDVDGGLSATRFVGAA